jgi:CRP/FNR family transcriptional regulator, cyclic AMP receptor protein
MMSTDRFFNYPTAQVADIGTATGFLEQADERSWDTLLAAMQTLVLRQGDVAFTEGQTDRALYLLIDGVLEVGAASAMATEISAPPAEILNEIAFLDEGGCTATARAATDARVLRLSFDAFEALAAREPQLATRVVLALARVVARRLRQASAS